MEVKVLVCMLFLASLAASTFKALMDAQEAPPPSEVRVTLYWDACDRITREVGGKEYRSNEGFCLAIKLLHSKVGRAKGNPGLPVIIDVSYGYPRLPDAFLGIVEKTKKMLENLGMDKVEIIEHTYRKWGGVVTD